MTSTNMSFKHYLSYNIYLPIFFIENIYFIPKYTSKFNSGFGECIIK